MALADARAMYPGIGGADADAGSRRALLEAVADWCDRYTPLVGLDAPDGLLLDITGCAHLFGGEAALCRDLAARLARQGLQARVAVADTVGCAWAVARYGNALLVVGKGETRAALSPLPLAALRIDDGNRDRAGAGRPEAHRRCDSIARARRSPRVSDRISSAASIRRSAARTSRSRRACRCPPPWRSGVFPIRSGARRMCSAPSSNWRASLSRVLERRGEGARLLQVALFRADGKVHRLELGTAAPLRDPARMRRLFADRLSRCWATNAIPASAST